MKPNDLRTISRLIALLPPALLVAGCTVFAATRAPTPGPAVTLPAGASSPVTTAQATAGLLPPVGTNLPPAGGSVAATPAPASSVGSSGSTSEPLAATGNSPASTGSPLATAPATVATTASHPTGIAAPTAAAAAAIALPSTPATITGTAQAATPGAPVLYQDDFTNPASGWPNELVFQDYYVGYHEPDFYHVEVHTPNDSAIVTAPGHTFDDFSAETRVQVSNANTAPNGDFRYGLVVRRAGNRYYAFTISPRSKTWYVLKSGADRQQVLSQGTQDTIHGLQSLDTLRVNAQGPVLTFFLNGQPVSQIKDPDYTSGEVGFYVETFDSPKAHIHYDNLVVRPPENLPPSVVVLYQDDFTNPASGWPNELVFQDYYVGYHEPDFYHVEVHTPNDSAIVTAPGHTFDDFSAETRVQVSNANTAPNGDFRYGLVVRRAGNRYYAFTISPRSKTWYVLKSGADRQQVLSQGTQDTIHGLQSLDTLRVNAQGPVLTFFLNGQPVSQIKDPDYTSGEVGFYVETFDSPKAHIHYDNLVVRPPEELPANVLPAPAAASMPPAVGCTVVTGLLNLRSGPSLSSGPIAGLYQGTQLDALVRSPDAAWIQVRIRGGSQVGWVSSSSALVSCDAQIGSLPSNESK